MEKSPRASTRLCQGSASWPMASNGTLLSLILDLSCHQYSWPISITQQLIKRYSMKAQKF
jgi:hypothetical protein